MRPTSLHVQIARRSSCQLRTSLCLALLILLGQLLIALPASAAGLTIAVAMPSFDISNNNVKALKLNGNAALTSGAIRLTPALNDQAGSAFWKSRVSLSNQRSFSSYFVLSFSEAGGSWPLGGDGIVFAIQTQADTAGGSGGGMGYGGITPSIGIEFDTWQNIDKGDPDGNHVGLDVGGSVVSVATASNADLPGDLKGNTWHVWVDYNGATQKLQVRMNPTNNRAGATLVLDTTRNLANDIGPDVYVGFTAGTGGAYENHDVKTFFFANDYVPLDTIAATYNQAPNQMTVTASPMTIAAGATTTITATVRDILDQPVPNQTLTFSTDNGTLLTTSGVTDANGQTSVTLRGSSGINTVRVSTVDGFYSALVAVTVVPNLFVMTVTASPTTIAAGATTTITATVRNTLDQPVPDQTVTFTTNQGSLLSTSVATNASGQASVKLKTSSGGPTTVRASAGGSYSALVTVSVGYRAYIPLCIR